MSSTKTKSLWEHLAVPSLYISYIHTYKLLEIYNLHHNCRPSATNYLHEQLVNTFCNIDIILPTYIRRYNYTWLRSLTIKCVRKISSFSNEKASHLKQSSASNYLPIKSLFKEIIKKKIIQHFFHRIEGSYFWSRRRYYYSKYAKKKLINSGPHIGDFGNLKLFVIFTTSQTNNIVYK